ncbi:sensor histidine kinase [Paenibacillus doosanensis]|uniref:Sensor histidine kinase YpdA n=1 Tax=Paenibacillus konkukensis TaxID=2020716 RepID=A0ABY4RW99_9BACL|nr:MULTISPECIES: sensor histidine kinase [Paenibacillus]MCS7462778.1 sensor histidine kinase [Paenibacillus doosanensis]UQZ86044.1 Sensor histidine kinase YpdA [Paenibacillus konkukensis]
MIRNSIRNKLIVFLLAATIVPIATSIIITYFFTKHSVSQETVVSNSNLIYQGKTNIMNYLKVIEQSSLSVYNDTTLYNIIESGDTDYISTSEIFRGVQAIANSVKEIKQAYLYIAKTNRSFMIAQGNPGRNEGPGPKYIPEMNGAEVRLEPTHISHDYRMGGLFYVPPATVVTMHRSIRNALTQQELGFLSIDFSVDVIRSICEQLYTPGQEELYILDRNGTVIYGTDRETWGKALDEDWVRHLLAMPEDKGSFEWKSKPFSGIHIYERMTSPYMEWTLVKRIPYENLYKNARELTQINTMIFSLFLIVVIFATLYISFKFTAPIKNLIGYIGKIQTGDMQVDIQVTSHDEIGILARRFRQMMQTINNLIVSEYKLDLANKTNQLKALQAQINPHFLYNSLQSIGTLALQHQAPKIYSLLSSLAKMMRYSMNTNETLVPLKQEIAHVKSYLELQMQRFENELTVSFEIDEETLDRTVPKMILQPLAENYFKHGFDPREKTGRLLITGSITQDNRLRLTVEDNGRGIDPDTLARLRRQLSKHPDIASEPAESIGLLNVRSRLALYYPGTAMKIEPCSPSGVRIVLLIPLDAPGAHQNG